MKMTLNSQTIQSQTPATSATANNERQSATLPTSENRSTSPNSSPRSSPKPSPRPQTKKEHANRSSDSHLSASYKESSVSKQELLHSLTDVCASSLPPRAVHSANELSVPEFIRQDSANSSVKDHKVTRSKKKSAWYSALYPTYKSRSEEFKKTFKDMPDDERLVVDYSCAMQKEILVHGRLYVSQNHLCFYANIFGWETNVTVRWRDVTAITKEKTALVIPNAILVSTRQDKYFLTSFVARDKTYLMLFRIWQNVLMDKPMGAKEMWHLVHQCYGEELGLTSDDEDYVSPSGGDDEKHSGRFSLESYSEECGSNADASSPSAIDQLLNDVKADETQPIPIRNHNGTTEPLDRSPLKPDMNLADINLPTDMSDTSDSDGEKAKALGSLSVPTNNSQYEQHDNSYNAIIDSRNIQLNSYISQQHSKTNNAKRKHNKTPPSSKRHPLPHDDSSPSPPNYKQAQSSTTTPKNSSSRLTTHNNCSSALFVDYDNNKQQQIQQSPVDDPSRSSSDEKLYPICTALHEGKQLMNEVVPMHVDRLFTLMFTASKFFLDFHQLRRTTDLSQTEWTFNAADGTKTRCVNLTAALNQTIGPKTAQVRETQTMLPCCKAGFLYAIDMETSNGGIPYADSFFIMVHFCLHKITDNQSSIAVYAQIKYKKSVWGLVKSMIEKNCWAGLEDFYNSLAIALHAEAEDSILNPEKRKVRVKQRSRVVQRTCSERTPNRSGSILKPIDPVQAGYKPDLATLIVFGVLILLVILNILLYYKLWSLEESPPYSIMDLHLIKNPPKNPDDWIKLLRQQEVLHSVEMQKWQQILKTAIQLLKQTEESLNELQKSIHPAYTSKLMSVFQSQKAAQAQRTEL